METIIEAIIISAVIIAAIIIYYGYNICIHLLNIIKALKHKTIDDDGGGQKLIIPIKGSRETESNRSNKVVDISTYKRTL